jgi:dienelactone hydrolase
MHDNRTTSQRRQDYLAQLKRVLPPSPAWEAWLQATGELPPDFALMPSQPDLPDPLLVPEDGVTRRIDSADTWAKQREALKAHFRQWVCGTTPPPPTDLTAEVLRETAETRARSQVVRLQMGPGGQAHLQIELLVPDGEGPFAVFVAQASHRFWALLALRRGYVAALYTADDFQDDGDSFPAAYPGYDWSRLTRRAWAAGRCMDYLLTLPYVERDHIALAGHSRNGKQALIAAAFDERIAAVISSSSGGGGALAARDFSERHFGEGIELVTRVFPDWFHPRLRFFAGREDRLPIDFHELVALVAPRACLISTALNDGVETTWAAQRTHRAVQPVYRLLGAENRLALLWRPGNHEVSAAVVERYIDWLDACFGRGTYPVAGRSVYPVTVESADQPAESPEPAGDTASEMAPDSIRRGAAWLLGSEPPAAANPGIRFGMEPPHIATMLDHSIGKADIVKQPAAFGEYIHGDFYLPKGLAESGRQAPAILWLPPFSFSAGYRGAYLYGEQFFRQAAGRGYAVFCFDPIGMGWRVEEAEGFYTRFPRWSLMGKMVRDARAALDVMQAAPYIAADKIWAVGFGLGAHVGLYLGALDERPVGLAAVCGPAPYQAAAPNGNEGSLRRWTETFPLLPRLTGFAGHAEDLPCDTATLMAGWAPRPLLIVSPQLDYEAPPAAVAPAVEAACRAYAKQGTADQLQHLTPEDYAHFGTGMQTRVFDWLASRTIG